MLATVVNAWEEAVLPALKRKSKHFPRKKTKVVLNWLLECSNPVVQRKKLAQKWLKESPYSSYRYHVEKCRDGKRIYLRRPTFLNKGFDFQVNLEGFRSRGRKSKGVTKEMPSHGDIINDLRRKVKEKPKLRSSLHKAISGVYDCKDPDRILQRNRKLTKFKKGLPLEKILKIIKWLFIEQDLTYWLGTGRNMMMSHIERKVFKMDAELYQ